MISLKIHRVLKQLSKERPIFHSEADFQYALALTIRNVYPRDEVRLEYPMRLLNSNPNDNRALDIWIKNKRIAIELKYTNRKLRCTYDGEDFALKSSRIHNYRYFFVEDLCRVEELVTNYDVERGFAIVITNNAGMWST